MIDRNKEISDEMLAAYLSGNAGPDEIKLIEEALRNDDELREVVEAYQEIAPYMDEIEALGENATLQEKSLSSLPIFPPLEKEVAKDFMNLTMDFGTAATTVCLSTTGRVAYDKLKPAMHFALTSSNDEQFNKEIFQELETNLYQYFSTYWGENSTHPVRFHRNVGKDFLITSKNEKVDAVYAPRPHLPFLVISPLIAADNSGFSFTFFYGGTESDETIKREVKPAPVTFNYMYRQIYKKREKERVVNELTSVLSAFASFIVDQYYLAYERKVPLLPSLLAANKLVCSEEIKREYNVQYKKIYKKYFDIHVEEKSESLTAPELILKLSETPAALYRFAEFKEVVDGSLSDTYQIGEENIDLPDDEKKSHQVIGFLHKKTLI